MKIIFQSSFVIAGLTIYNFLNIACYFFLYIGGLKDWIADIEQRYVGLHMSTITMVLVYYFDLNLCYYYYYYYHYYCYKIVVS